MLGVGLVFVKPVVDGSCDIKKAYTEKRFNVLNRKEKLFFVYKIKSEMIKSVFAKTLVFRELGSP